MSVIKYKTDLIKVKSVQTYKPKAQNLTKSGRRHANQTTTASGTISAPKKIVNRFQLTGNFLCLTYPWQSLTRNLD